MIAWIATLGLRFKLYALGALALLATFALFWFRWKIADARADKAEQEAAALNGVRKVEKAIQNSRTKLSLKQRALREEIAARQGKDFFDQGWGP